MEWSNKMTIEFLTLYEHQPIIWNFSHPFHKNRKKVNEAWKRIQEEFSIHCSVSELKRKKESLMARFRQCLAKIKESSKNGADPDKVYKPIWFAYEKMASFLRSKDAPWDTINSMVSI